MSEKKIPIESQKDILFSKLLPAINNNPFSNTYEQKTVIQEQEIEKPKEEQAKAQEIEELYDENDLLDNLHSRLFARQNTDSHRNYATVNIMEGAVLKSIDAVIQRFNACSCDRCKCDIAAQALSNLPAKYIVTNAEKAVDYDEFIDNKLVMSAIVTAVLKIRSKPRH